MTTEPAIFKQMSNAVLDLQNSDLQSYPRPIRVLGKLIQDAALQEVNETLKAGLDVDDFIAKSEQSQGSMVGSASLAWPDDSRECLGLSLLLIEKFGANPEYMLQFGFTFFYASQKAISCIHNIGRQLIIPFVRDYKDYVMSQTPIRSAAPVIPVSNNKVFIVHGHDAEVRETVARFVEKLGLDAIILHEQANQGRTVIEKVEANSDVGFAIVLLTPDDEGCKKGEAAEPRARQNVLLVLGYFLGRLGRPKVCALMRGTVEIPSDFAGVVWESMDSGQGWKLSLIRELKAAGFALDLSRAH